MGAKISNLYICPKCNSASSSSARPDRCPKCNYRFRKPHEGLAKNFTWEKLPGEQLYELIQQDIDKLLDAPLKDLIGSKADKVPEEATIHRKTKVEYIKSKWISKKEQFLKDVDKDQIESLMKTIYEIMQLTVPSGNLHKARAIVVMGKKIGEFANAIEEYINVGGKFVTPKPSSKES